MNWFRRALAGIIAGLSPLEPVGDNDGSGPIPVVDVERKIEKSQADYGVGRHDYRYLHKRYEGMQVGVKDQLAVQILPERVRLANHSIWRPDVSGFIKSRIRPDVLN